ncbi:hypothetical protein MAR_020559 [Mya arenaria]|uniref:Uncharacterized protein n=1 Tax=Mya arenaria TaxID=6604 RepID=A0ABY7E5R4_MYAAR|nr:hypothetical protein MAR_020559 [Mya arenaria]
MFGGEQNIHWWTPSPHCTTTPRPEQPATDKKCLSKSSRCLPFAPEKSANIIVCCFKLHNLCLEGGLPLPDISTNNDDSQTPGEFIHECGRGGIQEMNSPNLS